MKNLINAINENENTVSVVISMGREFSAELNFDANDITFADDGELYIRYDGVDIEIPMENATVNYDDLNELYEIECTNGMSVAIIF